MKKNIIYKTLTGLLLMSMLYACETDKLKYYEESADAYFTVLQGSRRSEDTAFVRFFYLPGSVTSDTVRLPITITGAPSKENRTVNIDYDREFTTAVENEHFILPQSVTIPADSTKAVIEVVILKAESLADTTLPGYPIRRLTVVLKPSTTIGTNFATQLNQPGEEERRSLIDYNIFISNAITKPKYWYLPAAMSPSAPYMANFDYFGNYSTKKFIFICETNDCPMAFLDGVVEWNSIKITGNVTADMGTQGLLAKRTQARLNQLAAAGDTVKDEANNENMTMGPAGQP